LRATKIFLAFCSLGFISCFIGCAGFFFGSGTTTKLTPSATNATYGTTITLTSAVAATESAAYNALGYPTGTVTFYDDTTSLGTGTLSSGSASYSTSSLSVGTHSLYAYYGGDGNYSPSTSAAVTVTINNALTSTTTTLVTSTTAATFGTAVTLTATESATAATGTVYFYVSNTLLGSVTLSNGIATLTTTALPVGTDSVTAVYSGDSTYASSTSSAATITITSTS
jgi:hypothetical protein